MKTLIYAVGALALASSAAAAAPAAERPATVPAIERSVAQTPQREDGYAAVVARRDDRGMARDWETNQGAGTSRSSDANNG